MTHGFHFLNRSKLFISFLIFIAIFILITLILLRPSKPPTVVQTPVENIATPTEITNTQTPSPTPTNVEKAVLLEESKDLNNSPNSDWWLSSGAKVFVGGGIIKTIQGDLSSDDRWYKRYDATNPTDTDNGLHPQNVFRLVSKEKFLNYNEQIYLKINKINLSESTNRDVWSGVFLFNRYLDVDNLYYTGVRMDGAAVIKKKINGTYYTLAYKNVYPGIYERLKNPNLIPQKYFIGLKSEVNNIDLNTVSIKLYLDKEANGSWELVTEALDDGRKYGGPAILEEGHVGIRSDFMDLEFKGFEVKNI